MKDAVLTVGLGVLAVLQWAWVAVYGTGPWRATRLGWVWLFKGVMLAVIWSLLFIDRFNGVTGWVWALLAVFMVCATGTWLWATVRARLGRL